jgi:hypothetical protein
VSNVCILSLKEKGMKGQKNERETSKTGTDINRRSVEIK